MTPRELARAQFLRISEELGALAALLRDVATEARVTTTRLLGEAWHDVQRACLAAGVTHATKREGE